jgi:hypothetical protein
MYNPDRVEDVFRDAYIEGYNDASIGQDFQDEKYPGSGHERDTTFQDELAFAYYCGQTDWEDTDE